MKFAIVEGERREAEPGLSATCVGCGKATVAKCGELRVWHWAHRSARTCDHWWEPETEWHRVWKNNFPTEWQEVVGTAASGERHIADVRTEQGLVLEFQHSFLSEEERRAREAFYKKMVWVVDGRRRQRDRKKFLSELDDGITINREPAILSVLWTEGALLRDWAKSRVPVYFDLGESEPEDKRRFDRPILWRLNPKDANGKTYLSPVSKEFFVRVYLEGMPFDEDYAKAIDLALVKRSIHHALTPQPVPPVQRYSQRARRRL
jgi:hypothetical protein